MHKRRKGIYVLPNLFTLAVLFGGFYAIVMARNGVSELASMGGVLRHGARQPGWPRGAHDEYAKRLWRANGLLSDMVSFGAAPALIAYMWALQGLGRWGWIAAVHCACAALRPARFNVNTGWWTSASLPGPASPAAAAW